MSFEASFKCKCHVNKPSPTLDIAKLFKVERCITYAKIHNEFGLFGISAKIKHDCAFEIPNAFWTREKYFVSLPLVNPRAQKASAALMSPTEINFVQKKLKNCLIKV